MCAVCHFLANYLVMESIEVVCWQWLCKYVSKLILWPYRLDVNSVLHIVLNKIQNLIFMCFVQGLILGIVAINFALMLSLNTWHFTLVFPLGNSIPLLPIWSIKSHYVNCGSASVMLRAISVWAAMPMWFDIWHFSRLAIFWKLSPWICWALQTFSLALYFCNYPVPMHLLRHGPY